MKKILIVDIGPFSGGVETIVNSVYDRLDKKKYHIDFLIYGEKCFQENKYKKNGNVYKAAKRYEHPVRHLKDVYNFFKKHTDYDIVWIQTRSCSNVNAHKFARRYTDAKIITHSHAIKPEVKNSIHRYITSIMVRGNEKMLASCTDYAIACSKEAYQYMFGKEYSGRGQVIINGIDLKQFQFDKDARRAVKSEYGISYKAVVLGHVGRMVPVKNHKFIVDVFENIKKEKQDSYLMLVGDGPEAEEIKGYVKQKRLENSVIFTGEVHDVPRYLSSFDVFMLPSFFEGLPLAAIEAQAAGLPAFISDRVPEDVVATEYAHRLSLEAGSGVWAKEILKNLDTKERTNAYDKLKGSDFDIERTVNEIKKIFEM